MVSGLAGNHDCLWIGKRETIARLNELNIDKAMATATGSWRLFYNCLSEDFLFSVKVDVLKI